VHAAAATQATPDDLRRPGHVFPLRARPGGVLERPGHTEATVDLMRLAGYEPCGVLCELTNADGTMARLPEIVSFGKRHGLPVLTVEDIVRHRRETEA
jgi:3,4-dihydroxy 2-butanone 4-phosphate synthase